MRCAVCARDVAPPARRMAGQPLCARCFDRPVVVRTARAEHLGARTFYVGSLTTGDADRYTVKLMTGRRVHCTCPDYANRGVVLRALCKHVRLVKLLARAAGGLRHVPHGATLRFRLADPQTVRRRRTAAHAG